MLCQCSRRLFKQFDIAAPVRRNGGRYGDASVEGFWGH